MIKLAQVEFEVSGQPPAAEPRGTTLRPSRAEVEQAVRTLIRWTGDDPAREGHAETPARVVRAYEDWFALQRGSGGAAAADLFGNRRI